MDADADARRNPALGIQAGRQEDLRVESVAAVVRQSFLLYLLSCLPPLPFLFFSFFPRSGENGPAVFVLAAQSVLVVPACYAVRCPPPRLTSAPPPSPPWHPVPLR